MQDLGKQRALSDLYLISALVSYGLKPLRIDRVNPKRQKFIFDAEVSLGVVVGNGVEAECKSLKLEEIETYFLSKQLYFPGNYPETIREIRATIHGYIEDLE